MWFIGDDFCGSGDIRPCFKIATYSWKFCNCLRSCIINISCEIGRNFALKLWGLFRFNTSTNCPRRSEFLKLFWFFEIFYWHNFKFKDFRKLTNCYFVLTCFFSNNFHHFWLGSIDLLEQADLAEYHNRQLWMISHRHLIRYYRYQLRRV